LGSRKLGEFLGFTITISIGIFGVLLLLVLLFTAGFIWLPSERNGIEFFALAVTAAGTLGGSFYVGESLRRGQDEQIKREAFGLIARWNSPDLFHARSASFKALQLYDQSGDKAVRELLDKDELVAANVRHVLNFLEEVAIAIRVGYADETILADAFAGLVLRCFRTYQSWIAEHRSNTKRQKMWIELEGLYKRWEDR
jgi:hypothetical protein